MMAHALRYVARVMGSSLFGLVVGAVSFSVYAQGTHDACAQIQGGFLNQTGLTAGSTNGITGGTIGVGEIVTMTATLGTATGGTFRIVGDPAGTVTVAGPSPIPGTLKWSGGPIPPPAIGIGYYIDTATGGTVNITASCSLQQIPTLSENMLIVTAAGLLLLGVLVIAARRRFR
jgi:hypothetical protein